MDAYLMIGICSAIICGLGCVWARAMERRDRVRAEAVDRQAADFGRIQRAAIEADVASGRLTRFNADLLLILVEKMETPIAPRIYGDPS